MIGGGIVGAGILRELSLQGIPLAFLFEKNDFASGTSGASSKLIHAGLRYLEQVWISLKRLRLGSAWHYFKFVTEASQERKILRGLAPHLIKAKPIYFVLGEADDRSSLGVMMGVWLYYVIQLLQGQFFPPPRTVFRKKALEWVAPELDHKKVKALFSFWDSETDDARLVIENLQCAHDMGSYALNYVELVRYKKEGDLVRCDLVNHDNGETLSVRAKILINASGPFLDDVRKREEGASPIPPTMDRVAGSHIDVYPAFTEESYYVTAGDGRLVFVLKRNEDGLTYSRIGTTERPLGEGEPSDDVKPTQNEIDYLKGLVLEFFPKAVLSETTIMNTDAGIRPLRRQIGKDTFHKSREHEIIKEGPVFHIVGVKLTDFRRVSSELMGLIPWEKLNLRLTDPKRSELITLRPHDQEINRMYVENDIIETIRRTMVLHWKDYVLRRRGLGPRVLARMDPNAFYTEFDIMKAILNWDKKKAEEEKSR